MSDYSYYLPKLTQQLVTQHIDTCQNLGLLLDKYVPQEVIKSKEQENKEERSAWLKELARSSQNHIDPELAKQTYDRWFALTNALQVTHFRAALDWRMVVGLGGETVLETDLTLHHLYGLPYIPGSALKGLARAYVTGEEQPSKKEEEDSGEIQRIFGSQKQAGTVLFFDAWPLDGQVAFAVDIMNSHYPQYYSEGKLPTNTQNPNPVTFLAVEKTDFVFALAPRATSAEQEKKTRREDVQKVSIWLQKALQDYGVGGKTSAGYGHFQAPTDVTVSLPLSRTPLSDPEMQQAEHHKRQLEALKERDLAGQIHSYYQHWQKLTSQEARMVLAQAIIEKARKADREKPWCKELLTFLSTI
ncbi:MAG: type III-B CRISPR module RAMP protein Cmr6 [Ktedonobacteraceae bacterium]